MDVDLIKQIAVNAAKSKMKTTILISSIFLILAWSCNDPVIVGSSAEIIGRSIDETLNDSALIYGFVYSAGSIKSPYANANIWIEGSDLETTSDISGNFSLAVLPGIYTIKCLGNQEEDRFTAVIENMELSPNEKIEIIFYHGSKSE